MADPKQFTKLLEHSRLCYTCGREQKGHGFTEYVDGIMRVDYKFCSIKCRDVRMDWTKREQEAMKAGIKMFGEYIESLERPALMEAFNHMNAKEFWTAIECHQKGYHEFLANGEVIEDEIPY